MMVLLQTFKSRRVSEYTPMICYDWAEWCQPRDMANISQHIGLNNAWAIKQGLPGKKKGAKVCVHCGSTYQVASWLDLDNKDDTKRLCNVCHGYRVSHGVLSSKEYALYRNRRNSYLRSKRVNGKYQCDGCSESIEKGTAIYSVIENVPRVLCLSCGRATRNAKRREGNRERAADPDIRAARNAKEREKRADPDKRAAQNAKRRERRANAKSRQKGSEGHGV